MMAFQSGRETQNRVRNAVETPPPPHPHLSLSLLVPAPFLPWIAVRFLGWERLGSSAHAHTTRGSLYGGGSWREGPEEVDRKQRRGAKGEGWWLFWEVVGGLQTIYPGSKGRVGSTAASSLRCFTSGGTSRGAPSVSVPGGREDGWQRVEMVERSTRGQLELDTWNCPHGTGADAPRRGRSQEAEVQA